MPLKAEKKLDAIIERLDLVIIGVEELLAMMYREFNPPVRISLSLGDKMADTQFTPGQQSIATITLLDASGNAVSGADIDRGTLVASFADGTTSFTLAPGADTSTFSVTANADAVAITDDVLTVNGSFNGVALIPGTIACDIVAVVNPDAPVSISVSLSTPS
jgi:hypothetical protein